MMQNLAQQLFTYYHEEPERTTIRLLYNSQPEMVISYRQLLLGSTGYARALINAGIQPGEVVILILQHGPSLIYAFFGAVLLGAIPSIMPFLTEKLSPDQYRRSLSALFKITKPACVITYPEFVDEVTRAIQPDSSICKVISTAQWEEETTLDLQLIDSGLNRKPDDIALLQHSSGTTGLQKGVALSHQAVFNQLSNYTQAINLTPEDVIVSWLPLYHDMGLIAGFLMPVLCNVQLVLLSPFDWVRAPYKLLQAISSYHGTLTWLPNFAYNFCANKIRDRDLEGVNLSSLRAVINCSEPIYAHSHELFLKRFSPYGFRSEALATCYAMAENVFAVTQGGIKTPIHVDQVSKRSFLTERIAQPVQGTEPSLTMISAGTPIADVQVKVLDEQRRDLPDRAVGELALLSDCLLTAYYQRPDLSEKAFHNGWYLTGDLGYIADGEVYVSGRKKDLIIVGGKNVYPQDLESLAYEVEGVHPGRVVAFGVPDEELGTEEVVIVAEIDLPSGKGITSEDSSKPLEEVYQPIADEIRRRVTQGSDIALRTVKLVERGWLLKTSSGKTARNANREKYLSEIADNAQSTSWPA
jgi:acyl-CoA synthetase (AMP-forming)/AMP-acid ligase II